jgi:hypothetical protein
VRPQIFFAADAEKGSGSSEPVKRLANRYGIPEKDVEALLYGSRAPKTEAFGSDTKEKIMADEFRPNYTIQPPPRERGWSPINVISAIVGVLGIMALTIILISVLKRHEFNHASDGIPSPHTAVPNPPSPTMQDTSSPMPKSAVMNEKPDDVPPPSEPNEIEAKPAPKKHHATSSHISHGFTTTNSIEAQEHLAELRADGNSKAKIHSSSKNGMTIYNVK